MKYPKDHALTHAENRKKICLLCLKKKKTIYIIKGSIKKKFILDSKTDLNNDLLPSGLCCGCKIKVFSAAKENSNTKILLPDYTTFLGESAKTRSQGYSHPCICKLCKLARDTTSWNFKNEKKSALKYRENRLKIIVSLVSQS